MNQTFSFSKKKKKKEIFDLKNDDSLSLRMKKIEEIIKSCDSSMSNSDIQLKELANQITVNKKNHFFVKHTFYFLFF